MARVIFFLIGCLLTVTAVLKLWMLMTDPFCEQRLNVSRVVILLVSSLELLQSTLLVCPIPKLLKATTLTAVFSGMLAWHVVNTANDCYCFGFHMDSKSASISVSVISLASLGLFVWLPEFRNEGVLPTFQNCSTYFQLVLGFSIPFLIVLIQYEEPLSGITNVIVSTKPFKTTVSKPANLMFSITNQFDFPVQVSGAQTTCNCVFPQKMQGSTILPRETKTFMTRVQPVRVGPFNQKIFVFLDMPPPNRITVDISGVVEGDLP